MRRSYGDNREKTVPIALRIAESLAADIEDYWKKAGMSSRSELIETAAEFFITSQKCPKCGAHNPAKGIRCSVCGENLGTIRGLIDEAEDLIEKICDIAGLTNTKYILCHKLIENIGVKDTFLLRRFDLITARRIVSSGEVRYNSSGEKIKYDPLDKKHYFLTPPSSDEIDLTYGLKNQYRAEYNIDISDELYCCESTINSIKEGKWIDSDTPIIDKDSKICGLIKGGGDRLSELYNITHRLSSMLINCRAISLELDQIIDYVLQLSGEKEKAKDKKKE